MCRINLPDSGKMRKERALPSLHFIREGILWEIKDRWPGGYFIFSCFSCRSFFSHKVHSLFGSRERKNKSKVKFLSQGFSMLYVYRLRIMSGTIKFTIFFSPS